MEAVRDSPNRHATPSAGSACHQPSIAMLAMASRTGNDFDSFSPSQHGSRRISPEVYVRCHAFCLRPRESNRWAV